MLPVAVPVGDVVEQVDRADSPQKIANVAAERADRLRMSSSRPPNSSAGEDEQVLGPLLRTQRDEEQDDR